MLSKAKQIELIEAMHGQGQSDAEIKVQEALNRFLPRPYEILASTKYIYHEESGAMRDREFDILVFHPGKGIMIMEVKGGGIMYDGDKRTWLSHDRDGFWHEIKDPFEQAQTAARALYEKIKSSGIFKDGKVPIPVGHCVFFPDIHWGDAIMPMNADRSLVLDSSSLARLESAVSEVCYKFWATYHQQLTKEQAAVVKSRFIFPACRVMPTLKSRIESDEFELVKMTEEQYQVLDMLEEQRQIAIKGYAGTGKTLLAMEKARRLYHQGLRVALVCYNRPLADEIRKGLITMSDRITVDNFHRLAMKLCKQSGIDFMIPDDDEQASNKFWNEEAPVKMFEAISKSCVKYDAIIVDEGQDFLPDWWAALEEMLTDRGKGYFYVFFDPQQNIYRDKLTLPVTESQIVLKKNCRNTKKIGELVSKFGKVSLTWPVGAAEGEQPQFIQFNSIDDEAEKINVLVANLLTKQQLIPNDIVVLSVHSRKNSCLAGVKELAGVPITEELLLPGNKIRFSSLHRFKGLEANVVILCDVTIDPDRCSDEHLYVAISRAKHSIYIFHDKSWKMRV